MKKFLVLLIMFSMLSGCAAYKFQRGNSPYDGGYVASRDGRVILEYTIGKDDSVPELDLAKKRFKKRRNLVEHYYKKMGYIKNNFKKTFWDIPASFAGIITGVFRFPFVAVADYRYENNPKYREKVRALEEKQDIRQAERIMGLKNKLNNYIEKELAKETPLEEHPKAKQQAQEAALAVLSEIKEEANEVEPQAAKKEIVKQAGAKGINAVIVAKPIKGVSPLRVQFYGHKSRSSFGKIFFYDWEFGDGDTSTEKNPVNTYICKSFGLTPFTAVLTVKDEKGNTATSSVVIEVKTAK